MYLDFFELREQPFGVAPDPSFLYLSQTHRDALEALRSDLVTDRGFMGLVGEPGLGKTTLLYKLLDEWRQSSRVVFLFQTQCDSTEFFRYLLAELGIDAGSMGQAAMHQRLNHILFQDMLAGRRTVLIVDEAQNLDDSVLETVRLLSNFETSHAKLLNIVLAGQPQLADKLASPGLRQLRQRIGLLNRLRPLTVAETREYIDHRLGLAGCSAEAIFTQSAIQVIAKASHGAPRSINNICHRALLTAATEFRRTVNAEMAENVVARIEGRPIEVRERVPEALAKELAANETPREAAKIEPPTVAALAAPAPAESLTGVSQSAAPSPLAQFVVPEESFAAPPAPKSAPTVPSPLRPSAPSSTLLSYGAAQAPQPHRRGVAALAVCVLLLAGAFAIPSVRRFAKQEFRNLTSSKLDSPSSVDAAAKPEASTSADSTLSADDPAAQDTDYGQVITVTPRTGETLEELCRVYVGHFDQQLYGRIYELNPDLKDPEYLAAGQLIRLPLPPGTLKKVLDTDELPQSQHAGTWQMAVAKVREIFSSAKR